jgi:hypothetical protein
VETEWNCSTTVSTSLSLRGTSASVPTQRLVAIFELLAQRERAGPPAGMLCSVAAEITGLSGAGIALVSRGEQLTSMCTSNYVASSLMDLELTVGSGPCVDACGADSAVTEGCLDESRNPRWLAYTSRAVTLGAGAVFAFPIRIGAVQLGALALYRDREGRLSVAQESDAYLMAAVIARAVLALQARAVSGSLAMGLEREGTFDFQVHQAAGMVAVQASMTLGDALVALRSHAYALTAPLADTAARVVARELWYDREVDTWRNVWGRSE